MRVARLPSLAARHHGWLVREDDAMATLESLCVLLRASASGAALPAGSAVPPSLLVMALNGRRFGMPLVAAVRVERLPSLESVPGAPREVLGVARLTDGYLPVFDPALLLGLGASGTPRFLLVIQHGQARAALALDALPELGERLDAPGFALVSAEELLRRTGTLTGAER